MMPCKILRIPTKSQATIPSQVYITLQLLAGMEAGDDALAAQKLRPWADEDEALMSTVRRTLEGHKYGDARTSVKFDRSLATTGEPPGVRWSSSIAFLKIAFQQHVSKATSIAFLNSISQLHFVLEVFAWSCRDSLCQCSLGLPPGCSFVLASVQVSRCVRWRCLCAVLQVPQEERPPSCG